MDYLIGVNGKSHSIGIGIRGVSARAVLDGEVNGPPLAVQSSDPSMTAHLHLEVLDEALRQIDVRELLEHVGVETKAWDESSRGEVLVEWDTALEQWVGAASDSLGLIFVTDASEFSGSQSNVWVAWHENPALRERVVWDAKLAAWISSEKPGFYWDSEARDWIPLAQ